MVVTSRREWTGVCSLTAHDPWEAVMAHHAPTHKRISIDADGRPQISVLMALVAAAAIVLLVLVTSAASARLVG